MHSKKLFFSVTSAQDLLYKLCFLTNTRTLDQSVWINVEDQIILHSIKDPVKQPEKLTPVDQTVAGNFYVRPGKFSLGW